MSTYNSGALNGGLLDVVNYFKMCIFALARTTKPSAGTELG